MDENARSIFRKVTIIMNKRQKKKLYKSNLIKIKKLHPKQGDVICLMPNLDEIDLETINNFVSVYLENYVFNGATIAIVPSNIKNMRKDQAEFLLKKALNDLREDDDKGGE